MLIHAHHSASPEVWLNYLLPSMLCCLPCRLHLVLAWLTSLTGNPSYSIFLACSYRACPVSWMAPFRPSVKSWVLNRVVILTSLGCAPVASQKDDILHTSHIECLCIDKPVIFSKADHTITTSIILG